MALPAGWPPRPCSGARSIRVYITGMATSDYADNAFIFAQQAGANTYKPTPIVPAGAESTPVAYGDLTAGGSPMGGNAPILSTDPATMIWAHSIRISNDSSSDLTFTFDGTNAAGLVKANTQTQYDFRYEAGIAVKGSGAFRVEAW